MGNVVSKRQAADVPQWRVNNTKNEYSFVIKSARLTNGKLLHLSRAYCIRAVSSRYAYTPTRLPRWKYFTITRIGLNEIPFNTPRAAWTFCSVCTALIMSTSRLADILPFTLCTRYVWNGFNIALIPWIITRLIHLPDPFTKIQRIVFIHWNNNNV